MEIQIEQITGVKFVVYRVILRIEKGFRTGICTPVYIANEIKFKVPQEKE